MAKTIKKTFDYTRTNFTMNWASGVALVGAIIWAVTVSIQNSGYRAKIDGQGTTIQAQENAITTLTNTVSTLQGSMETVNNTISAFTANPPSAMEAKIDGIYRIIGIYHGNSAISAAHASTPAVSVPADSLNNTMGTAPPTQ